MKEMMHQTSHATSTYTRFPDLTEPDRNKGGMVVSIVMVLREVVDMCPVS
jgi:hypothetical protein